MNITATNSSVVDGEDHIVWGGDCWLGLFLEFDIKRFREDEGKVLKLD